MYGDCRLALKSNTRRESRDVEHVAVKMGETGNDAALLRSKSQIAGALKSGSKLAVTCRGKGNLNKEWVPDRARSVAVAQMRGRVKEWGRMNETRNSVPGV